MPKTPLPDRIRTFLAQPQHAVIASVRPDGQPVSVATWYLLDGDEVLVNMDAGRRRLAYLRADPRVSLDVLDGGDWYTHVSLQGRIVRWRDDEGWSTSTDYPATTAVSRTQAGTAPGSARGSPSNGGTDGAACADSGACLGRRGQHQRLPAARVTAIGPCDGVTVVVGNQGRPCRTTIRGPS